jgi:hypothetical protein
LKNGESGKNERIGKLAKWRRGRVVEIAVRERKMGGLSEIAGENRNAASGFCARRGVFALK